MDNPFNGVTPDINVFGTEVNLILVTLLGGVWGIVLLVIAIFTLVGLGKWAGARESGRSEDVTEAAGQFKKGLIAFACAVAIPIFIGAIIFIITTAQATAAG